MKLSAIILSCSLFFPVTASLAQEEEHSDVEFGYEFDGGTTPSGIEIEQDERTSDGIQLFESGFEVLDPNEPGNLSSDEPGFDTPAEEGLVVGAGDIFSLAPLDAASRSAFGVGFVNFYNPVTDQLEAAGRLAIQDDTDGTEDVILNGASIESGAADINQLIGIGDAGGEIHDHLIVDLLDDATAQVGAYGVLFELRGDFAPTDFATDITSEPFWIVWNNGLPEEEFDSRALARFGISAVPEPGAGILLAVTGLLASCGRRRGNVHA